MKKYHYALLLFLEIYLVSCNKQISHPAIQTSRLTISNLSLATTFKDIGEATRNTNLSIGKPIPNHNISSTISVTSTDTLSSWQHVFMGNGILNYLSKSLGVSPITDSVNLNNLSGYSRNLINGVYDISLSTKPTTHLADSFIRFSANNLGFNIIQNTGINFLGITKDAVITIGAGNIQKGSTPLFTTVQNGVNVQYKFGIKNGYYFLYINDQVTGIVSVVAPNGQNLVKTLTATANIQFNISLYSPSTVGPLSLTITPFILKNITFENPIAQKLKDSLFAFYPFNGNAKDSSGNGNDGVIINGVTPTNDRFGIPNHAYYFDGLTNFIKCSKPGPVGNPTVSVSFWIKSNSINPQEQVIGWGADGMTGQDFRIRVNGNCLNSVSFDTFNSAINFITTVNDNLWDFYVVIYDGGQGNTINVAKVYKNGQLLVNTCFQQSLGSTNISSSIPLTFGKYHGTVESDYFQGALDDVKIWKRVLTEQEIAYLYTI